MTMFIRAKRVSDPLDDAAKARLRDCSSSSSSSSEHVDADPSFSGLIHPFLHIVDDESVAVDATSADDSDVDSGNSSSWNEDADEIRKFLDPSKISDPFLRRLCADVVTIAEAVESSGAACRRRAVMGLLRDCGYNAGVCKGRWESDSNGLTGGSYEYIDVVAAATADRYIVDVDFAAEFELARPTEEYRQLLVAVPRVMVARAEDVKRAVGTMAAAAKRSMKRKGLEVPPWRKRRYMLAKWLGPYRRTVATVPPALSTAAAVREGMIECRTVGFGCATRTIRTRQCGWCKEILVILV